MIREQAQARVRAMRLQDLIKMWNDNAVDHYCRYIEMHKMCDTDWWNRLANEMGAWDFAHVVMASIDTFNDSDMFFFYEEFDGQLISFSTEQELLELVGEDWFIDNLMK